MVDFGPGDMPVQQCFGTFRRLEARVHIYVPTLRGMWLNLLNTATYYAEQGAKILLRRSTFTRLG
jgi:hypothetical protein